MMFIKANFSHNLVENGKNKITEQDVDEKQ